MIERIPSTPPPIPPIPESKLRPKWSVMIPAYNCSGYLKQAIESVLLQDQGAENMQIEVVDDCSTDADVEAIVQEVGRGRVLYFRKEENMGSLRNFETCINRAKGHFVHILHGDDFILDGFYKAQEALFTQYPHAGASFTSFNHVDEHSNAIYEQKPAELMDTPGEMKDALILLARQQRVQPPAMVVKRSVYEALGSFYGVQYGEDWEMWVRIAAHYPILHTPECFACYRVHTNNITTRALTSTDNIKDIRKVIDLIQPLLPGDKRRQLKKEALRNFSIYYAWMSHKIYHDYKNPRAAMKQIHGALGMSVNRTTLIQLLKLYVKRLIRY